MNWSCGVLLLVLTTALAAQDYISMTKHREELALADQRFRQQAEDLQVEQDIRGAYQLLALEMFRERSDEAAAIRKRLSFLVADVLPRLPHKKDHRLYKEFKYVDTKLRELGHAGILD